MSRHSRGPWNHRVDARGKYFEITLEGHSDHLRPPTIIVPARVSSRCPGSQRSQLLILSTTNHKPPKPVSIVNPSVRPPPRENFDPISGLQSRSRRPIVILSPSDANWLHLPIRPIFSTNQTYLKRQRASSSAGNNMSDGQQARAAPALQPRRSITTTSRCNPIETLAPSSPPGCITTTGAGRTSENDLSPHEAYERRRSVYEGPPSAQVGSPESLPTHLNGSHNNNSISLPTKGPSLSCVRDSQHPERQQRPSDFSLDEILANIESGQLVPAESPSSADKKEPRTTVVPMVELRDVVSTTGGFGGQSLTNKAAAPLAPKSASTSRRSSLKSTCPMAREPSSSSVTSELSSPTGSSLAHASTPELRISDALAAKHRRSRDAGARRAEAAHGFEVAWLDFTYSVEPNIFEDPRWGRVNKLFHKERRVILKGLSGGFKSGQMVALMGPSGAGKTCLLESISGVRTTGIGGRMCLRGRRSAQLVIVPQYDDFMPQFSVEETIFYGSRMKNPAGTNHRKVANEVIEQLGLQVCRHNNIQRCSGGQRKRVAIAQELVSRPNILILDEPTSGLDSSCCYQTMRVLRDVLDQSVHTDQPMAIVSTIHQPSAKVFQMFDQVYLLGKTGYMAYSGPPNELLPTIVDVTGLECPTYSNPSDFMIEIVAYDYGEQPVEQLVEFERQKSVRFARDFEKRANLAPSDGTQARQQESSLTISSRRGSSLALTPSKSDTQLTKTNRLDQIAHRLKTSDLLNGASHVTYKNNLTVPLRKATDTSQRSHPFFWHTWVHLHRSYLQAIRDPVLNNMRIAIHLGFATLLVLLYGKKSGEARGCPPVLGLPPEITDPDNESMVDLADNVGYLFMCIMLITYVSLMSTVLTFPIDIKTVGKEYKNGWYGTLTYFLGKNIADLPFIVAYPVVYCTIVWYMTNQARDHLWRYLYFMGLIILNAMNSQSFGLILGAVFVNSVTAATFLGPVITIPWYLFTGFTKRTHRLAEPFKTTSKFLFTRYIFEGILDTVYGKERCNCSAFLERYYELRDQEASRLGQLISVETLSSLDYYDGLETVAGESVLNETLFPVPNSGRHELTSAGAGASTASKWFERTVDAASTVFADSDDLNLASLMDTNVKASSMFTFGLDFEPSCPSNYATYVHQDYRLGDNNVERAFVVVFGMLCAIRLVTFVLVAWKIRTRQL